MSGSPGAEWHVMTMVVHTCLLVVHLLAGAAWFGAMFYSHLVVQRRGRTFFEKPTDYEAFVATISHGGRWLVLGAFAVLGLTGTVLLMASHAGAHSPAWWSLVAAKTVLFVAALALFVHISWHMWPVRLFATAAEVPRVQQSFRRVAWVMLTLTALNMALGVLLHVA